MGMLTELSEALATAVDRAAPSVVRVEARRRRSQGSGVVWSADGLVVTADHVLEHGDDLTIGLADGRSMGATIVGQDSDRDVALLRAATDDLVPISRGAAARVGHLVLAIGRPDDRLMATVGVVNAVGGPGRRRRAANRPTYIQTDALLYPGFSGGPLVDSSGAMIGLNTSRFRTGAGVAIALDAVSQTVEALRAGGPLRRGYLGVTTQPVALPEGFRTKLGLRQSGGLLISAIETDTPADGAGLLIGDILLSLADQALEDGGDLRTALAPDRVGQACPLTLIRGGELRELTIEVAERP